MEFFSFNFNSKTSEEGECVVPNLQTFRDDYSIGWIAALPHERAAAMVMLDCEHPRPVDFEQPSTDKNSYSWGRLGRHDIVITSLAEGVYGMTSASSTAAQYVCFLSRHC